MGVRAQGDPQITEVLMLSSVLSPCQQLSKTAGFLLFLRQDCSHRNLPQVPCLVLNRHSLIPKSPASGGPKLESGVRIPLALTQWELGRNLMAAPILSVPHALWPWGADHEDLSCENSCPCIPYVPSTAGYTELLPEIHTKTQAGP